MEGNPDVFPSHATPWIGTNCLAFIAWANDRKTGGDAWPLV